MAELRDLLQPMPAALAPWGPLEAELIWTNELGGRTFRITTAQDSASQSVAPQSSTLQNTRFLKHQPLHGLTAGQRLDVDLLEESRRLRWAAPFTRVPQVLDAGENDDDAWLITAAINAYNPLRDYWITQQPQRAVTAIGRGLRRFHEALPVQSCPYTCHWLEPKLAAARATGSAPSVDQLVVNHGDPCVPNTLLDDSGEAVAHVDLGALGVADRWADLAVASMSISWKINFGPGYEDYFFAGYGIEPDWERIHFYRGLW